jgi:ketosteroid isomerase-like protein
MPHQNAEFMLRWYNEVWNKENENAIDEMFHPEGKAHGLGAEPVIGAAGFKVFYNAFRKDYKQVHITVDKVLVDGDYAVALCDVKAVHRTSDKPIRFSGTSIAEIRDGKLVNAWNYFDFLSLNIQIGKILPEQLV